MTEKPTEATLQRQYEKDADALYEQYKKDIAPLWEQYERAMTKFRKA